jgi:hypothetical protein
MALLDKGLINEADALPERTGTRATQVQCSERNPTLHRHWWRDGTLSASAMSQRDGKPK